MEKALKRRLNEIIKGNEKKRNEENVNVVVDTRSTQYKALIKRLEKYDNPRTDAVRMALLYLEDKGSTIDINQFEEYIKNKD